MATLDTVEVEGGGVQLATLNDHEQTVAGTTKDLHLDLGKVKSRLQSKSLLSTLSFSYVTPVLRTGNARALLVDDIPELPDGDTVEDVSELFEEKWQARQAAGHTSIGWALYDVVRSRVLLSIFFCFMYSLSLLFLPYLIRSFVSNMEQQPINRYETLSIAAFIVLALIIASFTLQATFYNAMRAGCRLRAAAMSAVYKKSFRLGHSAKETFGSGETVNLMSNDGQRLFDMCQLGPFGTTIPFSIAGSMTLLVLEVGWAALTAVGIVLLLSPVQGIIGKCIGRLRAKMLEHTDERVSLTGEALRGIRIVKMYCWEQPLSKTVSAMRQQEVSCLAKILYLKGMNSAIAFSWPVLMSCGVFTTYTLLGHSLTFPKIFAVLAILFGLRLPIIIFAAAVNAVSEGLVSMKRLSEFLILPEIHDERHVDSDPGRICLIDCDLSWDTKATHPILKDVSLDIAPGELVGVVGNVGSGKSALLSAFLGEMHLNSGDISMSGNVAFMGQSQWIRNRSLKDNILFGLEYDAIRYQNAIRGASLHDDIRVLPAGDMTEIGERGINLSGGQQARVSLARVIYRKSITDIVILDDVFSAVDMGVGRQMFHEGVLKSLSGCTRIITLNSHLHHLKHFDRVVVLQDSKDGSRSSVAGNFTSYDELISKFPVLMQQEADDEKKHTESDASSTSASVDLFDVALDEFEMTKDATVVEHIPTDDGAEAGELIQSEDRAVGSVGISHYRSYLASASAGNAFLAFIALFGLYTSAQVVRMGTDFWVSIWASGKIWPNQGDGFWIGIYLAFALGTCVLSAATSILFASLSVQAAKTLHNRLFHKMLRAPTSTFFDVIPLGRILNRFSRDLDQVDLVLPEFLGMMCQNTFNLTGAIIVACLANPSIIVFLVPLSICFYLIQSFFRQTSRELKRLEGITRSPIFSSFEETLNGISTIRAFGMEHMFIRELQKTLSDNCKTFLCNQLVARWLTLRLDMVAVAVVAGVAFFTVLFSGSTTSTALSALALIYALELTGMMQFTVRLSVEVENNMTAVERLLHYASVDSEAPANIPESDPGSEWPSQGAIELIDLKMRYRPGLELVLKGLNAKISAREKIGIVGRTGAGKSSVALALLRMIEPAEKGCILIDGVDVCRIGLSALRKAVAIIPQEAVLFSGTIRYNLDPFYEHSDQEVWDVLEQVHLKEVVSRFKNGIHHIVTERGQNLSYGQRQLVCIARAFLRNCKIIIADEATAGIDSETDQLIQKTIRELFRDRTVLTIAHRLHTIVDSDRIMVLHDGRVQELDTPERLLRDKSSSFFKMVQGSGSSDVADNLLQMVLSLRNK